MERLPDHTVTSAPEPSQTTLESLLEHGGLGRLLNFRAQPAHAPSTLGAYLGIRSAIQYFARLDPATRFAIQLAVSTADRCDYSEALNSMFLLRAGASPNDVAAIRASTFDRNENLAVLLALAREATTKAGLASDHTWSTALGASWTDTELADAFTCVALTLFPDYFVAYAQTSNDVPTSQPSAQA
jgi:Carboxymuconolactone decarboxylase family